MHKIAFFEIAAWEKDWLVKNLGGFSVKFYDFALDAHHLPPERDFKAISMGEGSVLAEDVLSAFPHLECVAVRSRSCSNISLVACRTRGVLVCCVPTHAVHAVAEFTFGLLLALTRKIGDAAKRARKNTIHLDGLGGIDLYGKILGVLGTGHIGSQVIRIAKGFGMQVLAWNPRENLQLASELGFAYVPLESLVAHADILTVHLPYISTRETCSTHHLLHAAMLSRCKRGMLLVNTAHADIADNEAVWAGVEGGVLGGVAIDADPAAFPEKFYTHPHIMVTPRVAYNTQETHEHILQTTAENIRAYFRGFPQCMA